MGTTPPGPDPNAATAEQHPKVVSPQRSGSDHEPGQIAHAITGGEIWKYPREPPADASRKPVEHLPPEVLKAAAAAAKATAETKASDAMSARKTADAARTQLDAAKKTAHEPRATNHARLAELKAYQKWLPLHKAATDKETAAHHAIKKSIELKDAAEKTAHPARETGPPHLEGFKEKVPSPSPAHSDIQGVHGVRDFEVGSVSSPEAIARTVASHFSDQSDPHEVANATAAKFNDHDSQAAAHKMTDTSAHPAPAHDRAPDVKTPVSAHAGSDHHASVLSQQDLTVAHSAGIHVT